MLITVFTPTYNRAHLLPRLYESLCKQTFGDFEWLIVDDGSSDETNSVVGSWSKFSAPKWEDGRGLFPIRYFYQENGGKPSAINTGMNLAQGELFFIVDSDDVLTPDALATIHKDWDSVKDRGLCGISYLRGYSENEPIGDMHPQDHGISNFIDVRVNQHTGGDKAEIWVTEYLIKYKYPIFPSEKFIGESWIWYQLAERYDMLFVNKVIYITEYLEGGLSQSGKAMRIKCPLGAIELCKICMSPRFCFKFREKKTMLYVAYHFFAGKGICEMMDTPYKLLVLMNLIPGYLLYRYWNWRFN